MERLHLREGEVITLELRRPEREAAQGVAPEADVEDETTYLLCSPRNRDRLLAALAEAERGEGMPMSLADVREEFGLAQEE